MFPQGGPGIGLLLLRIAVAGMLVLNLTHRFFSSNTLHWFVVSLLGLISLSLLLGFFTLMLSIVACIAAVANLFLADQPVLVYLLTILTSAALFFLGPGAYSVDARLFGLRVTVVPPRKDKKSATTFN
jgi:membrane protein implicated in regulation of membrane protease activity